MREVIHGQLWVGNTGDAHRPAKVLEAGVIAVINVAGDELPPDFPRDVIYCHFPLVDGPDNPPRLIEIAIRTIVSLLEESVPTLVYCEEGMSRSLAVAAAAVSRWRGEVPETVLEAIIGQAPHDISSAFWRNVRSHLAGAKG